jgi:hypothetical protein
MFRSPLPRLLSAFTVFLLCSVVVASAAEEVTIEVRKDGVYVQGKAIVPATGLATLESVLGKPDRVFNGYNDVHIYDAHGLCLFQPRNQRTVDSLALNFQPTFLTWGPKKTFSGSFKVGGTAVSAQTSKAEWKKIAGAVMDRGDELMATPSPVSVTYHGFVLTLEYLKSLQTLEGVGISLKD